MKLTVDLASLNPGQRKFVESEAPQVLLCGGFGSGKTSALAIKILLLKAANPGVAGLVVAQTFGSIEAVVLDSIYNLYRKAGVPDEQWPKHRDKGSGKDWLDFGDNARVHLRSAETSKGMDGLNVGWLAGDEIRHWSKRAYDIALGRRRIKCPMPQSVFASTPAMHWMAEEFNTNKPDRELINASTKENAENLSPNFVENLRNSYSPRMQRAVLEGEFTILEGAVFEDFDPNPQTSPWIIDWNPSEHELRKHRIFLAADPGFRRSAWIWIANVGNLEWVVFDQAMLDNHSDEAAAKVINQRGHPIDEVWIDPAAGNTQSAFGIDTLRILRQGIITRGQRAFRSVDRYRDIRFGIDKLRVLLGGYQDLPRRIRFTRSMCERERGQQRGIVKDLGALAYPEMRDGRAVTDLPLKDGVTDHSCLVGSSRVWTEDSGWAEISTLAGSKSRILTPCGIRDISVLGRTREQALVWEIGFASGKTTTATEDHPFIVSARCRCGRVLANVSWATILQMREILLQTRGSAQGVSSQDGMGASSRGDTCGCTRAPYRWRQIQQRHKESACDAWAGTPVDARKGQPVDVLGPGASRVGGLAQVQKRESVAHQTRQGCVEVPEEPGLYMPTMWQTLHVAKDRSGEVLPSKLHSHCEAQASRCSGYQKISHIRHVGSADVWCASVPDAGCFVLDDGTVSSNTDALRYFAVSRWLHESELRKIDPQLKEAKQDGYRIHFT